MVFWDDAKPKRRNIPKVLRHEVWNKYIGATKAEGKCFSCGRTIHIQDFQAGHNIAKGKGGLDTVANLRPICRPCNGQMGTMSILAYKRRLEGPATKTERVERKTKAAPATRTMAASLELKQKAVNLFSKGGWTFSIGKKVRGEVFDLCGERMEAGLISEKEYLLVECATGPLTEAHVLAFARKASRFSQKLEADLFDNKPTTFVYMVYTGILPKGVQEAGKTVRPKVVFKKV